MRIGQYHRHMQWSKRETERRNWGDPREGYSREKERQWCLADNQAQYRYWKQCYCFTVYQSKKKENFKLICRWQDSNLGPLVSQVTTLPNEPQPLHIFLFGHSRPLSSLFMYFQYSFETVDSKNWLMTGFEPWIYCCRRDCSTNCATVTVRWCSIVYHLTSFTNFIFLTYSSLDLYLV